MELTATTERLEYKHNPLTFARIQNAVSQGNPCIVTSPPGFGQIQLLRDVALAQGFEAYQVRASDQTLCAPGELRAIIAGVAQATESRALVIIEHDCNPSSLKQLSIQSRSYAEALALSRIDRVIPVLCTPLDSSVLLKVNSDEAAFKGLIVESFDLLTTMPSKIQRLLNCAPPHLHQSLLGITRLAESWPSMGVLLSAKLKGLGSASVYSKKASPQTPPLFNENIEPQISTQALKTICSELLNNYQSLMSDAADTLLTDKEQMLLAHLSLFPPNIEPYRDLLRASTPDFDALATALKLKKVLIARTDNNGSPTFLSIASLPWRFYAQGHLRRSSSAQSLNIFILQALETLNTQRPNQYQTLAIEFSLSAREYGQALEIIIDQAQAKDDNADQMARINQAVGWLKFIPQRFINQNPKARVIQSYHRLVAEQLDLPQKNADGKIANDAQFPKLLRNIGGEEFGVKVSKQHPRVTKVTLKGNELPISLQQVELPNHIVEPSPTSLLLDIQQFIEEQRLSQVKAHADMMINQAFTQQKPELFLHGIAYNWYWCQIETGIDGFINTINKCRQDNRLSSQLGEFRSWLNQIHQSFTAISQDSSEVIKIDTPAVTHLTSLGQNLCAFITCYLNATIASLECKPTLANDKSQDAAYFAMNIPDSFSQTLMPIWLIETLNFIQQNQLKQAITFIENIRLNQRRGSLKISTPLLDVFGTIAEAFATTDLPAKELESVSYRLDLIHLQVQAFIQLWQHNYKKSAKTVAKLLKKKIESPAAYSLLPWAWFGPSSWYLLTNATQTLSKDFKSQETELTQLENLYEGTYVFEQAYLTLSKRETEILGLVVNGCSNEEIANLLCRSLGTIKLHVHSIYKKLEVTNRVNAIKRCQGSGFFGFGLRC